ncbi:MAG: hypothetical protein Q4C52_05245 [Eubacteriales bacterium]|nr:hypothetical protein [Eubacteriales bacterium]
MKVYEKPRVSFERFELSQHVADCGWELQSNDVNNCYATGDPEWCYPTDVKAFTPGVTVSGCDVEPEGYCYTVGSGGIGLFKS